MSQSQESFKRVVTRSGEPVPCVYQRGGRFYARVLDPVTHKQRWVASRDGTLDGARVIVREAKRARNVAAMNAFHAAIDASKKVRSLATIGECLALYPEAARLRRMTSCGKPSEHSVNATVNMVRRNYAAELSWSVEDVEKAQAAFIERSEGMNVFTRRVYVTALKCVFASWAIPLYQAKGLNVPDVLKFHDRVITPSKVYQLPPKALRDATRDAGAREMEAGSDIGAGYVLSYFCAMSAGDAARARWDWLDEESGVVGYNRKKTGCRATPRLTPSVVAWWKRMQAESGREFVLPGESECMRSTFVLRAFSQWMRSIGWDAERYQKASHELRKLAASAWMSTVGPAWCSAWTGDTIPVLMRFYADFVQEARPEAPEI